MCIFDADQLANSDFYIKTVPLFDLGDDVGMVLSPQAFHNLRLHADIFNHANIHFWEYSQPGYDALGFISCTGAPPHPPPGLSLERWRLVRQVAHYCLSESKPADCVPALMLGMTQGKSHWQQEELTALWGD